MGPQPFAVLLPVPKLALLAAAVLAHQTSLELAQTSNIGKNLMGEENRVLNKLPPFRVIGIPYWHINKIVFLPGPALQDRSMCASERALQPPAWRTNPQDLGQPAAIGIRLLRLIHLKTSLLMLLGRWPLLPSLAK